MNKLFFLTIFLLSVTVNAETVLTCSGEYASQASSTGYVAVELTLTTEEDESDFLSAVLTQAAPNIKTRPLNYERVEPFEAVTADGYLKPNLSLVLVIPHRQSHDLPVNESRGTLTFESIKVSVLCEE